MVLDTLKGVTPFREPKLKIIENVDYNDINNSLKRPLQSGTQYDRYFQNSSCKPTYLGFNNIAFGVRQMAKWAKKNTAQTKDLALGEFRGLPLEETIVAVHQFLYNHIQYELDRYVQNVKSPACVWATRKEGTDCKSFSVFASSILSTLGIAHYFRRVKQPNPNWNNTRIPIEKRGINPNHWSHVYVIVPKNQENPRTTKPEDYYVLDATLEDNQEVSFHKKVDHFMSKQNLPYYGLQSPALTGLHGCTCETKPKPQPSQTKTINVASPKNEAVVRNIAPTKVVRTTPSYSDRVVKARQTNNAVRVAQIRQEQERRMFKGGGLHSPLFAYGLGSSDTSGFNQGASYVAAGIELYKAGRQGAAHQQAITTQGARQQQLDAIGQSGATSSVIYGVAGIVGTAWPGIGTAIGAILALVPADWYENKIGQLFEGWSCIGSSWSPKTGRKALETELVFIKIRLAQTLEAIRTATLPEVEVLINDFWEYFYNVQSGSRRWLATSAKKCTKKGLQVIVTGLDEFKKQEIEPVFLQSVSATGHFLERNGTKTVTYGQNADNGYKGGHPPYKIKVPQYKIRINPAMLPKPQAEAEQQIQQKTTKKKSNKAIGIAAMAALAYVAM